MISFTSDQARVGPAYGVSPKVAAVGDGERGFPQSARFAFSILDDTDDATVENVRPIYDLLSELGLRTTKTAWPLDCPEGSRLYLAGETLGNSEYLAFVKGLIARGFEVAYHGATMETSTRERTERGLREFEALLGVAPSIYCNHGQNLENVYWGAARYRVAPIRLPIALMERLLGRPRYSGHVPGSPYFWGDLCLSRFRFVRNFTFSTLDYGSIAPSGPYRLKSTPWVQYWFNTADAPDAADFKRLVTPKNVKQLYERGGACIVSTHLGKRFVKGGRVDPEIEDTLRYIASLPGWFRPVSEVLELLLANRPAGTLSAWDQWQLECRHVADRILNRVRPRTAIRTFA
jgi:hypothetical protein